MPQATVIPELNLNKI